MGACIMSCLFVVEDLIRDLESCYVCIQASMELGPENVSPIRVLTPPCVCVLPSKYREPTYDYKEDSVFCIEPPEISPQDERIYERSISVMTQGPLPPPPASLELYVQYAKMAFR